MSAVAYAPGALIDGCRVPVEIPTARPRRFHPTDRSEACRLRSARLAAKLRAACAGSPHTAISLARAAGVCEWAWHNYLAGRCYPTHGSRRVKIASALGVELEWLFAADDDLTPRRIPTAGERPAARMTVREEAFLRVLVGLAKPGLKPRVVAAEALALTDAGMKALYEVPE